MEINKIYCDDAETFLKQVQDNFFDSYVSDPPYGLKFMGKHWDYDVPKVPVFKEMFRTLKPGGHILIACGTRTQHRMAVNIEDAGFEIRDVISWLYGQGFPKSLNVNKQLDGKICNCSKQESTQESEHGLRPMWKSNLQEEISIREAEGEVLQPFLQEQGLQGTVLREESIEGDAYGKKSSLEGWCNNVQEERELQERSLRESNRMGTNDGEEGRLYNGTQDGSGEIMQETIEQNRSCSSQRPQPKQQQEGEFGTLSNKCNTQEHGAWETCNRCGKPILPNGIGTALKPSCEFWTLARKPLSENTVAENVLKHGTGGINIDGCRIGTEERTYGGSGAQPSKINNHSTGDTGIGMMDGSGADKEFTVNGRFPSNVILDEFMGKELDKQSGISKSTGGSGEKSLGALGKNGKYGKYALDVLADNAGGLGDEGGASRFFYCAKADNFQRNKGLKDFDEKSGIRTNAPRDNEDLKTPERKNHHPTVKPIDLMRYLVKLITPKGGLTCDPFCGSGTTLIGAKLELINYIGIDREKEYCEIAEARVAAWNPDKYKEQTLF